MMTHINCTTTQMTTQGDEDQTKHNNEHEWHRLVSDYCDFRGGPSAEEIKSKPGQRKVLMAAGTVTATCSNKS